MLQKLLATVGIGGATVETTADATVTQGGELRGTCTIAGGAVPQEIAEIVLSLRAPYRQEVGDSTVTRSLVAAQTAVPVHAVVGPGDRRSVAFALPVPLDCPISLGPTRIALVTGAEVAHAVDPTDRDAVTVHPDPVLESLIQSAHALGLAHQHRSGEVAYQRRGWLGGAVLQELKFRPHGGPFAGVLDELEFVIARAGRAVEALVEVDRRGGLLSEMLDVDETKARLRIEPHRPMTAADLASFVRGVLR